MDRARVMINKKTTSGLTTPKNTALVTLLFITSYFDNLNVKYIKLLCSNINFNLTQRVKVITFNFNFK